MLIVGKNYVISVPQRTTFRGGSLGPDDPLLEKAQPISGKRRPVKGIPTTYLGKPLTPALRKKIERRHRQQELERARRLRKNGPQP